MPAETEPHRRTLMAWPPDVPQCIVTPEPLEPAPMVLEGGSIAVDGRGTLVTTERCLLNPNRNPTYSRTDIERTLKSFLGVDRIVWLADAIAEDEGTDGHVDNVVAFMPSGAALV